MTSWKQVEGKEIGKINIRRRRIKTPASKRLSNHTIASTINNGDTASLFNETITVNNYLKKPEKSPSNLKPSGPLN